ncbi:MAG: ELWxxDGT repeat protein [Nostoc sp. DedVER02]|uniref:ELWxxDGT repeat protein n=1 Tax=unclassified Nostoc TaxID=2593658 RepID=UPI002AD5537F|nr:MULTISPECIES: ELWxxDGT repeat protein [unclassified Nostoc]MDZ7988157.1 pre-peptidase C-terminal domain-containing protein [Nostoc sp. DedVER02]MDZ8116181.1 pre-peptidase C-terminal domain-containing protein [Nostoc sp. DedVER01b]
MPTYSGFPDPGSTIATALNTATYIIGGSLTSATDIFQDSLSSSDTLDTYKFTINSSSIVTLGLDGLSSNADLKLLNSSGTSIYSSTKSGTTPESIRSNLAAGTYYAQVYSNNFSPSNTNYNLSLSSETILESNRSDNSFGTAFDIGTITSYNTADFVGSTGAVADDNDYYKFQLNNNGNLSINLNNLGANADVYLLTSSGTTLSSSVQSGTASESINTNINQGTYYIRVVQATSGFTNYNLQISLVSDPVDNAGNTLATARNINPLTTNSYSDFVNSSDNKDYYRFDLTSAALVNFSLTPATGNADLQLVDSNGNNIQSSNQAGTAIDSIRRSLNAGTYYALVTPGTGVATNYTLTTSAQAIAADQAPNSLPTAKNIGTLNGSQNFNDFVGNIDTIDYYTFNCTTNSTFNLTLSGLIDNADVQLLNSNSSVIQTSAQSGNTNETINANLGAGTYYVRIYISGANTYYTLDLSGSPQASMLDLNSGSGSSNPSNLTAGSNILYFTANDGSTGSQLWKSDGTVANTTRLTNINPGNFNPANLTVFNNKLYFSANDGSKGRELWVYDGTQAQIVSDINPNSGSSNPSNLTVVGNKLFFTADDGTHGQELWQYNGTTFALVKDIYLGVNSSSPLNLTNVNGQLFFTANNPTYGTELWSSDGTQNGTQVIDIRAGAASSSPNSFTSIGSTLYFAANDGTSGFEVWKYQAGAASLVKDATPNNNKLAPAYLTPVGNTLYFVKYNDNFQAELWKSDGTTNGTVRVKNDTTQAPNIGSGPTDLTAVGNTLYFVTYGSTSGLELWKTDGTDNNTVLVKDIWAGNDSNNQPNNSVPTSLVNFNSTLYFAASDGSSREVWSSDGTVSGTRKFSNIYTTGIADPAKLTVVGTRLFFTATNGTNGTELWVI